MLEYISTGTAGFFALHLTSKHGNRPENISSVLEGRTHSCLSKVPEEAEAISRFACACEAEENHQAT